MVFRLRKQYIAMLLCIVTAIMLTAMKVAAPPAQDDGTPELPIIMYHHIMNKQSRLGQFIISEQQFENDLIYLKENGYQTISMAQLLDYVNEGTPLPEKPVMLTFDDGHESFHTYAYPLLQKYQMCAVLSIVGEYTDQYSEGDDHNPSYAYLTWDEIAEMTKSGLVEIGNHTYGLHTDDNDRRGCRIKSGESEEEYRAMLRSDLQQVQDKVKEYTGTAPVIFTYPFGHMCIQARSVIKEMGFQAAFSCEERRNKLTRDGDHDWLFDLGRYNRPSGKSSEAFFKKPLGL